MLPLPMSLACTPTLTLYLLTTFAHRQQTSFWKKRLQSRLLNQSLPTGKRLVKCATAPLFSYCCCPHSFDLQECKYPLLCQLFLLLLPSFHLKYQMDLDMYSEHPLLSKFLKFIFWRSTLDLFSSCYQMSRSLGRIYTHHL